MKKSSIEQLFDEIFKIPFNTPEAEDLYSEIMDLKEKYKQLHKQEIEHAHLHNRCSGDQSSKCFIEALENAQQYYNDNFKSE